MIHMSEFIDYFRYLGKLRPVEVDNVWEVQINDNVLHVCFFWFD